MRNEDDDDSDKDPNEKNEAVPSDEVEDEDDDDELTFWQSLKKAFRDIKKEILLEVVDYGPPYVDNNTLLPESLIYECSALNPNNHKIHNLLNQRANPNTPDEEDLYFTPLHWCARRNHFKTAKMLVEAHCNVNAINEMGHTALMMATIFKPPMFTKNLSRLRFVKLLVENNADVNLRDKGGFSAIDFATMNQDIELVRYFLEHDARVTLENQYIVTKREHILTYAKDPDVYRIIKERLDFEQQQIVEEERKKEEERQRVLEEERQRQLKLDMQRMKGKTKLIRMLRLQQLEEAKALEKKRQIRESLDQQMELFMKTASKEEAFYHAGEWWRDNYNHWDLRLKPEFVSNFDKVYTDALKLIQKLKSDNDYGVLQGRWSKANAGEGPLRAVFKRNALFDVALSEEQKKPEDEHEKFEAKDKINDTLDFEYKNENDAELDGEDLDEIMRGFVAKA